MTRAVLWDLDGVLADTTLFHFQAWRELFAALGRVVTDEEFRLTFGLRNETILREAFGDLPPEEIERLSTRKEALFRARAEGSIAPLPGAVDLLQSLRRAGVKSALVTSTPRANIDLVLRSLGIEDAFQAVVAGEDVRLGKPDPEGFLLAARRLGVEPARCVVIEDAPGGVEAAKRAGMRCLAVTTTRPREALAAADLVVDSLADPAAAAFLEG